jgi:hypothetical protein
MVSAFYCMTAAPIDGFFKIYSTSLRLVSDIVSASDFAFDFVLWKRCRKYL